MPLFSTPTFWSANSGMNFATGSLSRKWPSSTSIMMPTETIGLVIEKMRKIELCAIGAEAAGPCRPSASNQPIWPRRATSTVAPGQGALVDLALEGVRHPLQPDRGEAQRSRSGLGEGGVCGMAVGLAAVSAVMVSPALLLLLPGLEQVWRRMPGLNSRFRHRFALAIGAQPMLETARTGGNAGSLQECSSIGRAPVSKTGGRRFEPCHSCQPNQVLRLISGATGRARSSAAGRDRQSPHPGPDNSRAYRPVFPPASTMTCSRRPPS